MRKLELQMYQRDKEDYKNNEVFKQQTKIQKIAPATVNAMPEKEVKIQNTMKTEEPRVKTYMDHGFN